MKIAYVTKDDPQDLHAWSGTVANIYKALGSAGHKMIPVGNLREPYKAPLKLLQILIGFFTGKLYLGEREPIVLKSFARQIKKRLAGVDWERKGADVAVRVAQQLNRIGVATELHIVGCTPPGEVPEFVKLHGFVSKKTDEGQRFFDELFSSAHFSILPARAECCAMVFAEASSFGVPTVTTDVGGIPTAIRDGVNGFTFPLGAEVDAYSKKIRRFFCDQKGYRVLATTSFEEYTQRLNWDVAAQQVGAFLSGFINDRDRAGVVTEKGL